MKKSVTFRADAATQEAIAALVAVAPVVAGSRTKMMSAVVRTAILDAPSWFSATRASVSTKKLGPPFASEQHDEMEVVTFKNDLVVDAALAKLCAALPGVSRSAVIRTVLQRAARRVSGVSGNEFDNGKTR